MKNSRRWGKALRGGNLCSNFSKRDVSSFFQALLFGRICSFPPTTPCSLWPMSEKRIRSHMRDFKQLAGDSERSSHWKMKTHSESPQKSLKGTNIWRGKKILPFVTIWMNLQNTVLSEPNAERRTVRDLTWMRSLSREERWLSARGLQRPEEILRREPKVSARKGGRFWISQWLTTDNNTSLCTWHLLGG